MNNFRKLQRALLGIATIAAGTFLAACDSSDVADGDFETMEVQDLYTTVVSELQLSSDQQTEFRRSLRHHDHGGREPGYLWIVADSLSATLTDGQIEDLLTGTDAREGFHPFLGLRGVVGGGGYYGFGGLRGVMGRFGDAGSDGLIDLSPEQQEAIKALHEETRAEVISLREEREAGTLSGEDFVRALIGIHESLKAELDNILTDEQKAALEQFRAEREAEFEAFRVEVNGIRNDVLQLTSDQIDAFDTILQDHLDMREVLHEQFLSGELSLAEFRTEVESLREAIDAALEALLDADQYLVVQIHNALTIRLGHRGHFRRRGPDGPR